MWEHFHDVTVAASPDVALSHPYWTGGPQMRA